MANLQLNNEQKIRYQQIVDEEIRAGRLREDERAAGLRGLKDGGLVATRVWAEHTGLDIHQATISVYQAMRALP